MNGGHDLGGMHGLGPVEPERDEPVFHHEWERRCFAITLAAGMLGEWNIDMSRQARERMHPAHYLDTGYYEHWLHGLELLLEERGLVSRAEIDARVADGAPPGAPPEDGNRAVPAARVPELLARGAPVRVDADVPARFRPGDRVRARNIHPAGHTRLPRYARAHAGTVEADYGVFVFADANATGGGPDPQHLYRVAFDGRELWGPQGGARDRVHVDLWDPHLEPA